MNWEPGRPCFLCGVRADVDCRHRAGETALPPPPVEMTAGGRVKIGASFAGRHFCKQQRVA